MTALPEEFEPDEKLGRQVAEDRWAKSCERGHAHVDIFFDVRGNDLSVDRLKPEYVPDAGQRATAHHQTRVPSKKFSGWAVVIQEVATMCGCTAHPSATCRNPYHASIVVPRTRLEEEQPPRDSDGTTLLLVALRACSFLCGLIAPPLDTRRWGNGASQIGNRPKGSDLPFPLPLRRRRGRTGDGAAEAEGSGASAPDSEPEVMLSRLAEVGLGT